jgi:hypothetical protein
MVAADTNRVTISLGRAQDWIDTVINPILDGIRRELRFLPMGPWRWPPNLRTFEFFLPTKEYVPHPYADNYDDFIEKHQGVREGFDGHDSTLARFDTELAGAFDALSADQGAFKAEVDASLTGRGHYGVSEEDRDWFISFVAGNFERLPDYYTGHDTYNVHATRLLAAGRGVLARAKIDVPGVARQLADIDTKLVKQLVEVRRDLADHYGARIRPS